MSADPPLDFAAVWALELDLLLPDSQPAESPQNDLDALKARVDAHAQPLTALCLSGGGIRSASFALGVLQALASFGLLDRFHYLSTVSGGGFIGSWLSAWRHAAGDDEIVKDGLLRLQMKGQEAPEVAGIRADSNYLTPRLGLVSADTWTVMALYIRNLVLNWCIYAPLLLSVMLVPRACLSALQTAKGWLPDQPYHLSLMGGLLAALFFAIASSQNLYSRHAVNSRRLAKRGYLLSVLLPTVIGTVILTCVDKILVECMPWQSLLATTALIGGAANGLAVLCTLCRTTRPHAASDYFWECAAWIVSGVAAGALAAAVMLFINEHPRTSFAVVLELGGLVLALFAGELVYVGLTSFVDHSEHEREWLARSTGWLFATALLWIVWAGASLYGPWVTQWLLHYAAKTATGVAGVSGLATLLLGWSEKTAAVAAQHPALRPTLKQVASLAALVFTASLALLFARLAFELEIALVVEFNLRSLRADWLALPACFLLAAGISLFININRFSLHALYRNRLIRAFLGSARASVRDPRQNPRDPDPFTGFDANDNVRMSDLTSGNPTRLFHVINTTLNVLSSSNPAWQERKAESFVITPLACGNPQVGFRRTARYGARANGITLGTAMAISGAAVSPNQGYNSSPLISILLMLFNVRLGWWLGNPRGGSYRLEGPRFGLEPALRELVGATTDVDRWVYLSDGGHFENLGLYEMVRRRCRMIFLSDVGCDPQCTFLDLGNAARKCYIDFGVRIDFTTLKIAARQDPPTASARFAFGTIHYPDGKPGRLIYIKPTYFGTEPPDIRSYAAANKTFPHESTADQWFSESQLEAYRALGAHIVEEIGSHNVGWFRSRRRPGQLTLEQFFEAAEHLANKASPRAD